MHPTFADTGGALDAARAAFAGTLLGFCGLVLCIKQDWMECVSLGFPSCADGLSPCPLCWATLADCYCLQGISPVTTPWMRKSWLDYRAACDTCEIIIDPLGLPLWRKFRASLAYDARKEGAHGRALLVDIPEAGLQRGDRLEPSEDVMNIGDGFDLVCPRRAVFWRRSADTMTRHRNPCCGGRPDVRLGWMHTGPLGVVKYFLGWLMWELINANVWNVLPAGNKSHRLHVSAVRVRAELFDWYASESAAGKEHCRVQDLTDKMFGSELDAQLHLYAAEMMGFFHFARTLIDRYGAALGARQGQARNAQESLQRIHEILKQYPVRCSDAAVSELVDSVQNALRALQGLGIPSRFKMHGLVHLAADAHEKGSPALWATWTDEGLNRILKAVSLNAHCRRDIWTERVLSSVQSVLDRRARKRPLQ